MSLSRSEQARINGAKSRGPKTEAGKARSAMNATKHNLSGQGLVVLDNENEEAFQELFQAFLTKFQPEDSVEHEIILQAAAARWRLRRIWKLETGIFNTQMLRQERRLKDDWHGVNDEIRQSEAFLGRSDALNLLNRYERTISREYQRALKDLDRARAERQYRAETEANNDEPAPECEAGPQPAAASQAAPQPEIARTQNEPKPPVETAQPQLQNQPGSRPDTQNSPLPGAA